MKTNKEIKEMMLEYFNIWDLEVEGIDSIEQHDESIQMFDYIINSQLYLLSLKKDQIMKKYKDDDVKMYNELSKLDKNPIYKRFKNIYDYSLKLQTNYKNLYKLKQRRAKQNMFLRNELTKNRIKK